MSEPTTGARVPAGNTEPGHVTGQPAGPDPSPDYRKCLTEIALAKTAVTIASFAGPRSTWERLEHIQSALDGVETIVRMELVESVHEHDDECCQDCDELDRLEAAHV